MAKQKESDRLSGCKTHCFKLNPDFPLDPSFPRSRESSKKTTREADKARQLTCFAGFRLAFDASDAVKTMEAVASGSLDEPQLADWFRQHISSK